MGGILKYLSFRGRSNRKRYWLTVLSIIGLFLASALVGAVLQIVPFLGLIVIPVWVALVIAIFANATRRLHDRNKSAWWLLLFYVVPVILGIPFQLAQYGPQDGFQALAALLVLVSLPFSLWGLVELGFLKGSAGPNRFGEDPLPASQEPALA